MERKAIWNRLRNGIWGVKTIGFVPTAGDVVTVTRRDGQTREATIGAIIWQGYDRDTGKVSAICSTVVAEPGTYQRDARTLDASTSARKVEEPAAVPTGRAGWRGRRKPAALPPPPVEIDTTGEDVTNAPAPTPQRAPRATRKPTTSTFVF